MLEVVTILPGVCNTCTQDFSRFLRIMLDTSVSNYIPVWHHKCNIISHWLILTSWSNQAYRGFVIFDPGYTYSSASKEIHFIWIFWENNFKMMTKIIVISHSIFIISHFLIFVHIFLAHFEDVFHDINCIHVLNSFNTTYSC